MIDFRLSERFHRWRARTNLRSELWSMDERQLSDIGITRNDIELVVRGQTSNGQRPNRLVA
jgi:uncharacterized protein YjiS (DUF1127 family)